MGDAIGASPNDALILPETEPGHHSGERYWEIDAVRGIAILGMLFFHVLAVLVMFHIIVETETFLRYYNTYALGTAIFVIIAGIAMVLRHERMHGRTTKEYYTTLILRGFFLFLLGMGITLASWIGDTIFLDGTAFIKFGFLHMLGISMIIAVPLLRFRKWNLIFGLIIMAVGFWIIPEISSPEWLFPLGIHGEDFLLYTQDYFPLFPWAGVLLLGVGLGNVFYPNGIRGFKLTYQPKRVIHFLTKLGNGMVTLFIYLVHIPVIFVIMWIFGAITGIGYL
ncbi:MAG: heparan-alpha-glucosaminide N-acetyltransferase [Methanocorpusculum sp.]|nr:heparan-alpha-glucosaminide N-acetyltransferase [Methanocorpusculum sp.]